MKASVTPWFSISENPQYAGVYEVQTKYRQWFSRWDGKTWRLCRAEAESAALENIRSNSMEWPHAKWRGLAVKP